MLRSSRLVQLLGLAAMGMVLGTAAQILFGPPNGRSSEPPRSFSVPLDTSEAEALTKPHSNEKNGTNEKSGAG